MQKQRLFIMKTFWEKIPFIIWTFTFAFFSYCFSLHRLLCYYYCLQNRRNNKKQKPITRQTKISEITIRQKEEMGGKNTPKGDSHRGLSVCPRLSDAQRTYERNRHRQKVNREKKMFSPSRKPSLASYISLTESLCKTYRGYRFKLNLEMLCYFSG